MSEQTIPLAALTRGARPDVVKAIRQASAETGVDFAYLLEKASAESSLDPEARAETSSARGLYQFIDRTWLDTMDRHGAAHGYPNIAKAITRDAGGNPVVTSAAARDYILALRENPRISALMAGEFTQDNGQALAQSLGRDVNNTELYMAHFLGANGAAEFIREREMNGGVEAHKVVPAAARANASVFYDQGQALTLDEVFARFEGRFGADLAALQTDTHPVPGEPGRAAIFAAPDPRLAVLQAMQAFNEDPKPNEWVV